MLFRVYAENAETLMSIIKTDRLHEATENNRWNSYTLSDVLTLVISFCG